MQVYLCAYSMKRLITLSMVPIIDLAAVEPVLLTAMRNLACMHCSAFVLCNCWHAS